MITITTVLKTGKYYDYTWVDKMKRSLDRHMSIPFRFCPLTDVTHDYESYNLEYDNPGYWNKIELFKPGLYKGPTCYIDLDNVITGDLSRLIYSVAGNKFVMHRNDPTKHSLNPQPSSCIMYWESDMSYLWNIWISKSPTYWQNKYSGGSLGDQAFIRENITEFELFPDLSPGQTKKIIHTKSFKRNKDVENAIMYVFSAKQKPFNTKIQKVIDEWAD
jgi:hypothetical protein